MSQQLPEKIQQGQAYAAVCYVPEYLEKGQFPLIHKSMHEVIKMIPPAERRGAIDIGACHGMLSLFTWHQGFRPVIGLEADAGSVKLFDDFLRSDSVRPGVTLRQAYLDPLSPAFEEFMAGIIVPNNVTTIVARRVLSEVFATIYGYLDKADPKVDMSKVARAGQSFTNTVQKLGVRYLAFEGRAFSRRSVHPLPHTQAERDALGQGWKEIGRHRAAVLLEAA